MAAPHVEIRDAEVLAAYGRLIDAGEKPDPILEALGRQLKTNIQLGFHTGTDPYGRPWAPLKIRAGQPLRDKGNLMNSIDYKVEGESVVVGTNLPYARTHQFGATIEPKTAKRLVFMGPGGKLIFAKKVTIPARAMFPIPDLPESWRQDLISVLGEFVRGRWSG